MSILRFQKFLDVMVKFASLAITAPVTFTLGLQVFGDLGWLLCLVLSFLAVMLVEGVFLSNWLLLEEKRNNSPDQKLRYALTVIVLYIALLGVAIQHGEGWAGVTFRLALGLAILGSTWDTITYSVRKSVEQTAQAGQIAWRVKRNMRNCNIKEAIAKRESELRVKLSEITASESVALYNIEVNKDNAIRNIETVQKTIVNVIPDNHNGHHPKVSLSVAKGHGHN